MQQEPRGLLSLFGSGGILIDAAGYRLLPYFQIGALPASEICFHEPRITSLTDAGIGT